MRFPRLRANRLDIQPYAFPAMSFAFSDIGRYSGITFFGRDCGLDARLCGHDMTEKKATIKRTHFWQLVVPVQDFATDYLSQSLAHDGRRQEVLPQRRILSTGPHPDPPPLRGGGKLAAPMAFLFTMSNNAATRRARRMM
jgi:hypothetical protein